MSSARAFLRFILISVLGVWSSTSWAALDSSKLLPEGWHDNLRFAVDLSARGIYNNESDEFGHAEFIGFDLHKVFTGDTRDVGTLILQGYLTRINNLPDHPHYFDDKNDWEFVYRIFNFNYNLLPRGYMNIRVGHFEVPYGIEHTINTNGTLRDYTSGRNLGVKADWGSTINGNLPRFEYEIAVSRGSGNNWETRGDPYIYAGRIGTHRDNNFVVGLSVMSGDVYDPSSPTYVIDRDRYGLDFQWYTGSWGVFGEYSIGDDESLDISNGLFEINRRSQDGGLLIYSQLIRFATETPAGGWNRALSVNLGAKWDLNRYWDLSAQLAVDIDTYSNAPESEVLAVQARYRF